MRTKEQQEKYNKARRLKNNTKNIQQAVFSWFTKEQPLRLTAAAELSGLTGQEYKDRHSKERIRKNNAMSHFASKQAKRFNVDLADVKSIANDVIDTIGVDGLLAPATPTPLKLPHSDGAMEQMSADQKALAELDNIEMTVDFEEKQRVYNSHVAHHNGIQQAWHMVDIFDKQQTKSFDRVVAVENAREQTNKEKKAEIQAKRAAILRSNGWDYAKYPATPGNTTPGMKRPAMGLPYPAETIDLPPKEEDDCYSIPPVSSSKKRKISSPTMPTANKPAAQGFSFGNAKADLFGCKAVPAKKPDSSGFNFGMTVAAGEAALFQRKDTPPAPVSAVPQKSFSFGNASAPAQSFAFGTTSKASEGAMFEEKDTPSAAPQKSFTFGNASVAFGTTSCFGSGATSAAPWAPPASEGAMFEEKDTPSAAPQKSFTFGNTSVAYGTTSSFGSGATSTAPWAPPGAGITSAASWADQPKESTGKPFVFGQAGTD